MGLRSTPGLISRFDRCLLIKRTDTPGPMCRTVHDAALILDVLVGFGEGDPWTSTAVIAGSPKGGLHHLFGLNKDLIYKSCVGFLPPMLGQTRILNAQ